MKGYVNIPESINCRVCKTCGSRPIISLAGLNGYVVKCPACENHYRAKTGLIDIEDWNIHNTKLYGDDFDLQMVQGV